MFKQQNFAMNTIEETLDIACQSPPIHKSQIDIPPMTEQKQLEEVCQAGQTDDNTSVDKKEKEESQSEQIIKNRCEEYKFTTIVDKVDVRIKMEKKSDQSECINNENHEIYI